MLVPFGKAQLLRLAKSSVRYQPERLRGVAPVLISSIQGWCVPLESVIPETLFGNTSLIQTGGNSSRAVTTLFAASGVTRVTTVFVGAMLSVLLIPEPERRSVS